MHHDHSGHQRGPLSVVRPAANKACIHDVKEVDQRTWVIKQEWPLSGLCLIILCLSQVLYLNVNVFYFSVSW